MPIKIIDSLGIEAIHFVASIEIIQAGNVLTSIDFTESNELKLSGEANEFTTDKKKRGRPKLTEGQKAMTRFKREAGKTRRFAVGEEPNKRSPF